MKGKLEAIHKMPKAWLQANRRTVAELIERSKEPYYTFEPYMNRRSGKPSWQWGFICAKGYKGRLALAGNRTGKTEAMIFDAVMSCLGQHPTRKYDKGTPDEPCLMWIVGLDFSMVSRLDLPLFDKFLPKHIKKMSHFSKSELTWRINRPDGGCWLVVFKSADAARDKFQGFKVDTIRFDEEPRKTTIFKECEARLIDKAGDWQMAATPINGTAWLKGHRDREDVFDCTGSMLDNPYIPLDEVEKYAAELSEEERMVRVDGKYIVFGGRPVFSARILNKMMEQAAMGDPPEKGVLEAA